MRIEEEDPIKKQKKGAFYNFFLFSKTKEQIKSICSSKLKQTKGTEWPPQMKNEWGKK